MTILNGGQHMHKVLFVTLKLCITTYHAKILPLKEGLDRLSDSFALLIYAYSIHKVTHYSQMWLLKLQINFPKTQLQN